MKGAWTLGLVALLNGGIAAAAGFDFANWDADADDYLSGVEFTEGFERSGLYGDWDLNDDDLIAEGEFDQIGVDGDFFPTWDANEDGYLDRGEVNQGLFDTYDTDTDRQWNADERNAAGEAGWAGD